MKKLRLSVLVGLFVLIFSATALFSVLYSMAANDSAVNENQSVNLPEQEGVNLNEPGSDNLLREEDHFGNDHTQNELSDEEVEQDEPEDPSLPEDPVVIDDINFWDEVTDTTVFPYSSVVYIESKFPYQTNTNKVERGSGVLIGPDIVLTAAHCIYNREHQEEASWIRVYPGAQKNSATSAFIQPFGSAEAVCRFLFSLDFKSTQYATSSQYIRNLDIAMIRLDRPLVAFSSYISISPTTATAGMSAGIISYPCVKEDTAWYYIQTTGYGIHMCEQYGSIKGIIGNCITYDFDTLGGSSGGPILNASNQLIGIHSWGDASGNRGVCIDAGKRNYWIQPELDKKAVFKLSHNDGFGNSTLFTIDQNISCAMEVIAGWVYERVAWYSPKNGTPVYELIKDDHHLYTTSSEVRYIGGILGWTESGTVFRSGGTVPVYQVKYEHNGYDDFYYTTNVQEKNYLVSAYGCIDDGIAFYCVRGEN